MLDMKISVSSNISESNRLFSNLEFNGKKLQHQPGSILGSVALVAGTTVGAGILALPAFTLPSGIVPSTVLLVGVWLYALVSALLIAEVTLNNIYISGQASSGLLPMVENTLGKFWGRIAGGAYLFLHYSLLVAYIAQGGDILLSAFQNIFGLHSVLPSWIGTTAFTIVFGGILFLGRDRLVEKINSAFVGIVIVSFVGLLFLAAQHANPERVLFQNWSALPPAVSVMLVALFYHNIVPVVTIQLEGDVRKIRQSIIIGSLIPLLMFLAWNAVILASISPNILSDLSNKIVFDPLQIMRNGDAGEFLGALVSIFSEFAIVTSFIGFVYGLSEFFKDTNIISQNESNKRLSLMGLVLVPPMSLSTLNPSLFFTALDYAGTFSISVLGGILPALMVWKQRYQQDNTDKKIQPLVSGAKLTLILMILIAVVVIFQEVV